MEEYKGLQLDLANLAGPPGKEELAREDEGELQLHFGNLHDENEDQSGEVRDWADGRPYDNSTHTEADDVRLREWSVIEPEEEGLPGTEELLSSYARLTAARQNTAGSDDTGMDGLDSLAG